MGQSPDFTPGRFCQANNHYSVGEGGRREEGGGSGGEEEEEEEEEGEEACWREQAAPSCSLGCRPCTG